MISLAAVAPSLGDDRWSPLLRAWSKRPRRAVLFDFNGTLSDDEPILIEVYKGIFAEYLGWEMTLADYRQLWGLSDREMVQRAVQAHGHPDKSLVDRLLDVRHQRYAIRTADRSPILQETEAMVDRLVRDGVPIGVVTGARGAEVAAALAGSRVGRHVSALVAEEDVQRGKPDPEGYLTGARLLGVDPSDVLVFEDSVSGIIAARSAGMECVAVTGTRPDPEVAETAAACVTALTPALLEERLL